MAILGIENRGLEKILPRQPSKAFVWRVPARHRAGAACCLLRGDGLGLLGMADTSRCDPSH
jgi:hypothetical protein